MPGELNTTIQELKHGERLKEFDPVSLRRPTFSYHLIRTYDLPGNPDERPTPLGCSMDLDDFQVSFHPDEMKITISLCGQQVDQLKKWEWPDV